MNKPEWLEIVKRDYAHLSEAEHHGLVDHILKTHPDHKLAIPPDTKAFLKTERFALYVIIVLLCLLIGATLARGQAGTSQIDVITVQGAGIKVKSFAAPFNLNFTGCTVTSAGSTATIACNAGSVTNNPAGANFELQTYSAGAFGFVPEAGLGKVLIDQGPGNPPAFADPLVQGTQAAGSTTQPNPVLGGGWDGTALRAWKMDASGNGYMNINGTVPVSGTFWQATQPVSGTFWQATQPVSIASMPTTPVTGTFWQATQPVSGTFWQTTQPVSSAQLPAALDGSGFFKVHEQGTVPVTGTFWQATQPVSIASMPSTPVTGTFWQATQPVSGTVSANLNAGSNNLGKIDILGNAGAAVDQAPGSAAPANALQMGGTDGTNTRVPYLDPCAFSAWTYYPINVAANTQIIAGSASKNVYVCQMFLAPTAAAANVNIVESATSGNACATSPTGMMGGATAALGAQASANGGFVLPAGSRAWMKTATSGDAMCIFASAQVTGVLAYVQF